MMIFPLVKTPPKPRKARARKPASPAEPAPEPQPAHDPSKLVLWSCYKRRGRRELRIYFEVPEGTPNFKAHEIAGIGLKCTYDISSSPVKERPEGLKESHRIRKSFHRFGEQDCTEELIFYWIPPTF